jgi:hypothetical protein
LDRNSFQRTFAVTFAFAINWFATILDLKFIFTRLLFELQLILKLSFLVILVNFNGFCARGFRVFFVIIVLAAAIE